MKNYYFFCYMRNTETETALIRYSFSALDNKAAVNACKVFLQDNVKRFLSIDICYIKDNEIRLLQHVTA